MNTHIRPALAVLCTVSAAIPLAAQCSSGPFIGVPFTLSMADDAVGTFPGSRTYQKATGFQTASPGAWTPIAGVADFRLSNLFRSCGVAVPPFPDVDALSLGEDWILADDATGRVAVPQNNWGALTFSVTRNTSGQPNSVIRSESTTAEGAAADLFSYVLPGSAMPAELVGRTERVHDSREVDLGAGAHDVDAIDQFVPLWALEPNLRAMMLDPPEVFFSFSNATLNAVPAGWWAGTAPSGATIFHSVWTPTTASWSCPSPWKTYLALGLAVGDDIDALAVDLRNQRLLLSTTSAVLDPLLFVYCGTDTADLLPYKDVDGIEISEKLELLLDDDIDAICAMDPSVRAFPAGGANAFWFHMGTPVAKTFPLPRGTLSSSAFRTYPAIGASVRTFVSGWPAGGRLPGIAALFLSPSNAPHNPILGPILIRDPQDSVCGNPLSVELAIPPVVALTGSGVDLRWLAADAAITDIAEAFPVRVRL